MKKVFLLSMILGLVVSFAIGQQTWDNFEDQRKGHYNFVHGVYLPYTANPDMNGNSSAVVAKYSRNAAEQYDVIVIDAESVTEDLTDYISGTKQMTMDVWSPASGITVQITLEDSSLAGATNYPTGRHSEYTAVTTQAMAWETLTFSLVNQPDMTVPNTTVGRLVIQFNPDSNTDDDYYFDNLVGPALAADPCDGVMASDSILNDFECNQNANITFNHGNSLRRIPNPDMVGNTSSYVASYTRTPAEEFDVIVGEFPTPLTLGDTNAFRLMVWDANSTTVVRLALQNDDGSGNPPVEVAAIGDSTSRSNSWEELEFRFGDLSMETVNRFVLLFDPGNFSSDSYFFDQFSYVSDGDLVSIENFIAEGVLNVYPNPSQGLTQFSYDLLSASPVSVNIYDMAGRQIDTINPGLQAAGKNTITWDATQVPEGLYIYRFQVNDQISSGKLQIVHE